MRVYDRQAFLSLPSGVLYAKGVRWSFNDIAAKGETIELDGRPIDWYYRDFAWVSALDSDEAFNRLEAMLDSEASFPMETSESRDGCFDDEDVFLVFERADLIEFRAAIEDALKVS